MPQKYPDPVFEDDCSVHVDMHPVAIGIQSSTMMMMSAATEVHSMGFPSTRTEAMIKKKLKTMTYSL
jgi:hypothetical protein